MKGMLDFLEKAGLVRKDSPAEPVESARVDVAALVASADVPAPGASTPQVAPLPPVAPMPASFTGAPLNLDEIYASSGIAPSLYPAERLLRLVDGLSAMDEATRLMAIKAMDAADESWSIEDPLSDAAAKVKALAAHAAQLQSNLLALQAESQSKLDAALARQELVVGDIRKQISELEALVSRELARTSAETAAQEASLKTAQDQTARELAEITQISQRLQSLSTQFGTPQK